MNRKSCFGRVGILALSALALAGPAAAPLAAQGLAQSTPAPAAPRPAASPDKFSGVVFGDYYYFKNDNVAAFEGQQGFWLRRIYFTYDRTFSPAITMRFRLDSSSNGKLATPTSVITPVLKDAWLKWAYSGKHQVTIGIQPTATIDFVDTFVGLRHIERTAGDLYRLDSTRDFGISLSGPLNRDNTVQYTAQVGNDSNNNSEIDKYKAVRFALRYVTNPGLVAEAVYAYHSRPLSANRATLQGLAAYQNAAGRVGVQYIHHTRQPATGTSNAEITINIVSGFGVWMVKPGRFSVIGRFDHSDANPDGAAIDYLPISPKAPFNMGMAGFEYYIHPSVRVSPNVEWVKYGTPVAGGAARPANDLVFRLTWFGSW